MDVQLICCYTHGLTGPEYECNGYVILRAGWEAVFLKVEASPSLFHELPDDNATEGHVVKTAADGVSWSQKAESVVQQIETCEPLQAE